MAYFRYSSGERNVRMGNVIVTGAGGFVGGNVVDFLSQNNVNVYATWHNHEPSYIGKNIRLIRVDLNDMSEINKVLSNEKVGKIDAIIHLAAQLPGTTHIEKFLDNTINATRNIVSFAQERKIDTFIYASTIGIYGDTMGEVNENTSRVNLSDYSMAKYIGERIVECSDIPKKRIIRLPRMVGRGMTFDCPWIPSLTYKLMQNREVQYYNPDNLFNQIAHVDSLSDFLLMLLENNQDGCLTVGIGASEPIKIIEVIELLKYLFSSSSKLTQIEIKKNDSVNLLDISRAVSIGFRPLTVKETLERLVHDLHG